jgi:hypothetical protein
MPITKRGGLLLALRRYYSSVDAWSILTSTCIITKHPTNKGRFKHPPIPTEE